MLTTLQRYKTQYGITDTEDDAAITLKIEQVSAEIETFCNRSFAEMSKNETKRASRGGNLLLEAYPAKAVALKVAGEPVDCATEAPEGIICGLKGGVEYQISYTAGYAVTPPDVEAACMELVSFAMERRGSEHLKTEVVGPLRSDFLSEMPASVREKLERYRAIPL